MPSTCASQKTMLQLRPCHNGYLRNGACVLAPIDSQSVPLQSIVRVVGQLGDCSKRDSPNAIISLGTSTWASEMGELGYAGPNSGPRPRFSNFPMMSAPIAL